MKTKLILSQDKTYQYFGSLFGLETDNIQKLKEVLSDEDLDSTLKYGLHHTVKKVLRDFIPRDFADAGVETKEEKIRELELLRDASFLGLRELDTASLKSVLNNVHSLKDLYTKEERNHVLKTVASSNNTGPDSAKFVAVAIAAEILLKEVYL